MRTVVRTHRSALTALLPVVLVLTALSSGRTAAQQAAQGRGGQPPAPQAPAQQPPAQQQQKPVDNTPRFQESTGVTLVSVDVVVRDASGNPVPGLTDKDFTIKEDGKPQRIDTWSYQEVDSKAAASTDALNVLDGLENKLRDDVKRSAMSTKGEAAAQAAAAAIAEAEAVQNRRMMVLLFDVSSMQPEDTQRAVEAAQKFVDQQMGETDLVSVVSIGNRLNVLSDFSSDREDLYGALQQLGYANGTLVDPTAITTALSDDASTTTTDDTTSTDASFEDFNNDVRLRAIKTLCTTIGPINQRKAMMYFSAGMSRSGDDNQIELNSATNTCRRGNVLLYPVDVRGLQAVVAGGSATSRTSGGTQLFNGRGALSGFNSLNQSQSTLSTLAADTGGRAFTDSNDFGDAFKRVQKDLAAYYLLGYSSTNTSKDGKFRRIEVTVNRKDLKGLHIEARQGYYAGRNFSNTTKRDRQAQLDDELAATLSSTDLPMVVGTGFFRQQNNSFYVPIAVAIPGFAVPVGTGAKDVTVDLKGEVRDEQGRTIARIAQPITVPAGTGDTLAGKQVFYETGANLPPGRFSVKIVARENTGGSIGSFEAPIVIPQLHDDQLKVSSVVMSTQIQKKEGKSDNPLVRDGQQLLPNLTRTVARNQKMYFYYEVYDPQLVDQAADLRTGLTFYRAGVKVFETATVERTMIDEPNRKAVVFQFEVPAEQFKAGNYNCQITIVDAAGNKGSYPRLSFTVIN
jgi:VWFA-related protein